MICYDVKTWFNFDILQRGCFIVDKHQNETTWHEATVFNLWKQKEDDHTNPSV